MSLPSVNIVIGDGNMGQITLSGDDVTGPILARTAVFKKLDLNKVYILSSTTNLKKPGIEQDTNPLLHKGLTAFYATVGGDVELHLIVVGEATTLTQMCVMVEDSPPKKLVGSVAGRIRLVDVSRNPSAEYPPAIKDDLDTDVQTAIQTAQNVAESSPS